MTEENEEVSKLPKGWCWVQHKNIAEINPKLPSNDLADNLIVSFLPMAAVEEKSGRYNLSEVREYEKVRKGYTPFINGDLIFAKITPCMENGKVAIVENLQNGIGFGSTEFHVSRLTNFTSKKYLFYYFTQERFKRDARQHMTGSAGQLRVPKPYFEEVKIPLAPLPEQKRIIEKIEELFSDLDQGIDDLKTAQKQLKVYRQAVLKWAFEGQLTEEWREQAKQAGRLKTGEELLAQIKIERENRYQQQLAEWEEAVKEWEMKGRSGKKPTKPQKLKKVLPLTKNELSKLSYLPSHWHWVKIGDLTTGVEYGSATKSKQEGKVAVLRMGNIQNCIFDWSDLVFSNDDDEIEKYLLKKGDVLFNRTNSPELVGKTAIYQGERLAIFAGYLIRINQISEIVLPKYLNYFLNSITAKKHGNDVKTDGVNQSNINGDKLANYPFPYTSLEEQEEIVQEIESRLSICDRLEATIIENLQKAEALRQSILKQAFEGKLVPQDPNDEPAEKLLERIKRMSEKCQRSGGNG